MPLRASSSRNRNPGLIWRLLAVGFKRSAQAAGMFFGSEPAQPRVRAAGVEVSPPGFQDKAGVADGAEQRLI